MTVTESGILTISKYHKVTSFHSNSTLPQHITCNNTIGRFPEGPAALRQAAAELPPQVLGRRQAQSAAAQRCEEHWLADPQVPRVPTL